MFIENSALYKQVIAIFDSKGYTQGEKIDYPIYQWNPRKEGIPLHSLPDYIEKHPDLTPGHFTNALSYCEIKFQDVPERFRTREFYIYSLSDLESNDIKKYIKEDLETNTNTIFDKQFFKDYIKSNSHSLSFNNSLFSYVPLEYIDEELMLCALLKSIESSFGYRQDFGYWFYDIYSRKPDIISYEVYCIFAANIRIFNRENIYDLLQITPEEFKSEEFYLNLCTYMSLNKIFTILPEKYKTPEFYIKVLKAGINNIKSFDNDALETIVSKENIILFESLDEKIKTYTIDINTLTFWKAVVLVSGYSIKYIPLNEERIKFFESIYDKDSIEYVLYFKDYRDIYLQYN